MAMDTEGMPYDGTRVPKPLTIQTMTAQAREVNIAKGWRPADGGPGTNTFGDYIALAHSELSEALEAYRDHRLEDATARTRSGTAIPDAKPEGVGSEFADVLIRLLDMADVFGIDLEREYVRKLAYNRTRSFQHGGRTLAEPDDAPTGLRVIADVIREAIPDDPRDWWTGDEVDEFLGQWARLSLPRVIQHGGRNEVLTLWVDDVARAAEMLGETSGPDKSVGFELTKGAYTVHVIDKKGLENA